MLRSQTSQLEPRPSDRIRVGDCVVDLPLREIAPLDGSAEPVRVTLKSIAVLTVLIAHAGKLVSREALLEWVWPDTLPTDDVVTQAIAQLRRALHDDRDHPRYIDTLSKQGYRLIAAVEWLADDASPTPERAAASQTPAAPAETLSISTVADARTPGTVPATTANPMPDRGILAMAGRFARRASRPHLPMILSAVLLAVAALAFALSRQEPRHAAMAAAAPMPEPVPMRQIPIRRIVSLRSRESEPSLSPDGAQVAYSSYPESADAAVLMVQTTAAVTPRALTTLTPGRWDLWPAWSPDGRQIAFLRMDREQCRVMLLPATGGAPRDLAECRDDNFPLAWFPDGKALIGIGATRKDDSAGGRALFRLDASSGVWSPIAYARSAEDIDVWPKVSPDGRWIAFQRNLSLGDLWRIPVEGGTPERLTTLRANFFGLTWTPDSRGVVFSHTGPDGIVLSLLDLGDRRMRDYIPEEWALKQPVVAGSTVAFVIEDSRSSMRRLTLKGVPPKSMSLNSAPSKGDDEGAGDASETVAGKSGDDSRAFAEAEPLFASTRSEIMPSIAPDGRQLFFASDRDGELRLWWVDQSRPESMRPIEGFAPVLRYPAVWNADSSRVLVLGEASSESGPDERGPGNDPGGSAIYEIDTERGHAKRLSVPDRVPVHAAYHPDPNRLLVVAEREQGRLGLVLYDRSRTPWKPLAEINDVVMAVVDRANRRVVFVRTYKPGIWQADLDLGSPREVDRVAMQPRIRTVVAAEDGVWFLDVRADCRWYWRPVAVSASQSGKTEGLCLGDGPSVPQGLSYDAAHRRLYAGIPDEAGRDIGVLPLSAFGIAGDALARRD